MPRPKAAKSAKSKSRPETETPEPPAPKPDGWRRFDLINRGSGQRSPAGTATFVGLRLLDLPWQYYLLRSGLAERAVASLGLATVVPGAAVARTGVALLDRLDLSPARLLLLAMAAGATAKQLYWLAYLNGQEFPAGAAAVVAATNSALNTANALLLVGAATSSWTSPGPRVPLLGTDVPLAAVVGAAAYVAGLAVETVAEYQRKRFKDDARNRGRVCAVGLWRWARHINYFGYALWRGGYCMAAAGWVGGLLFGIAEGWDLSTRAAGVLDEYCSEKYGEQWAQFKRDVPYRIVPGLY